MVGIPLHQIAQRDTVIGTQQLVGLCLHLGVGLLDRGGERFDIIGAVEIGFNRAGGGLPFLFGERGEKRVIRGGRGGTGVLRVQREEQDLLAARSGHRRHLGLGRRVAVAHAVIDHDCVTIPRLHRVFYLRGLLLGDGHQRAFPRLVVPDRLIRGTAGEGAFRQDHQLKQRLPFPRAVVDDAAIRQKFR